MNENSKITEPFTVCVLSLMQADNRDLTLRQLAILLLCLKTKKPQTIRGMATALHIPKPSVSRAVDYLELRGYASRVIDAADRRSVLVDVTYQGRAFLSLGLRN
jgi:DNA-binding MarR family transcriptional regulator